jgi:molecular chaperone DnaK (HSP70)
MCEGDLSRAASTLVLQEVIRASGEDVHRAVITVPAYFNNLQREGTKSAAHLAGIRDVYLLNEPTAAAIWIASDSKETLFVFDLGGGTFDASVVSNLFNCYDVIATDGCAVGGDDFDEAITQLFIQKLKIPGYKLSRLQCAGLKFIAQDAKLQLQQKMHDITVNLAPYLDAQILFTPEDYIETMESVFANTISITHKVIKKARIFEDWKFAFAGGSTRCPFLRSWIRDTFKRKSATQSYNPDKVVALGASLYARLLEHGIEDTYVSDVSKRLSLAYFDNTFEILIEEGSKLPATSNTFCVSNSNVCDKLCFRIYEGNSDTLTENNLLGKFIFEYSKIMQPDEGEVYIQALVSRDGFVTFKARELLGKMQEVQLKWL